MVVGFAAEDGHGAVELFGEEQTDHLMAESHLAQGDLCVGAGIDGRAETVRSAHDEGEIAPAVHPSLELCGKIDAAVLLAMLVEENKEMSFGSTENHIALLLLLLRLAQALGIAQFGQDGYLERDIMAQTADIVVNHADKFRTCGFAYYQ